MEAMDALKPEIARLFAAKEARRTNLRRCLSRKRSEPWFVSRRWLLRCCAREVERCAYGNWANVYRNSCRHLANTKPFRLAF